MDGATAAAAAAAAAGVALYCCATDKAKAAAPSGGAAKVVHVYRSPGLPPPKVASIGKTVAEHGIPTGSVETVRNAPPARWEGSASVTGRLDALSDCASLLDSCFGLGAVWRARRRSASTSA
jgi:hypothetical protein|eukprot:COSAG01_NODE_13_length_41723_cov_145.394556_15_plen_122_part_00